MRVNTCAALLLCAVWILGSAVDGFQGRGGLWVATPVRPRRATATLRAAVSGPTEPLPVRAIETMNSVDSTWEQLEDVGNVLTTYTATSLFFRALFAGLFIGLGGTLTASCGFDAGPMPWTPGAGLQRFFSGAIGFPLSILLIYATGSGSWTGDMLLASRAFFSAKNKQRENLSIADVVRFGAITWAGCLCGSFLMAMLITGAGLPACLPCVAIAEHKLHKTFLQTFCRGVGGGALICLAIFLFKLNRDMTSKVIGIWWPVMAYVASDFEHVLATMFFLSVAKLNGSAFTFASAAKLLAAGSMGNLVGGALLVGLGYFSVPTKQRTSSK